LLLFLISLFVFSTVSRGYCEPLPVDEQEKRAEELTQAIIKIQVPEDYSAPDYQSALGLYRQLIDECPTTRDAEAAYFRISTIYLGRLDGVEHWSEVAAGWEEYLKTYPESPYKKVVERQLALCYMKLAEYDKAIKIYQELIEQEPDVLPTRYYAGKALYELGDLDGARKQFAYIADAAPDSTQGVLSKYMLEQLGQ
jgi:tetratricopeptide (TPR) repeat protein